MNDLQRYALAVGAVALSTLCRWLLDGWLGDTLPFITYIPAVALVGLYAGFGPGIVTAVCGGFVSNFLFMPPRASVDLYGAEHWLGLVLFFVVSGLIISLTEQVRRVRERRTHELEESNALKDQFISMVAHELRNPLAAIVSATELARLKDSELSTETRMAIDIIDRQSAVLDHLVEEVLDVARISGGRIALKRAAVDLADLAAQCIETARPRCAKGGVELVASGLDESVWVDGDRNRLRQVLTNLLNNACNQTSAGNRISLTLERRNEYCVVRVADDGAGIDPAQLGRVFEPFFQVKPGDARQTGGLGVSLHLVARLVEMHGGHVKAHSDGPGRGAEFVMQLSTITAPRAEVTDGEPLATGIKVLVIDDNRDAAMLLKMLLNRLGQQAEIAANGQEGLDRARELQPEVVFVDLLMPGMDGFEVARRLREQSGRHARLIALTGLSQQRDRDQALAAGFDDLIVKPATAQVLVNVMRTATA